MSEGVSANDNRHETCNLGDGPGEQGLNGGEASVEGGPACLSVGGEGKKNDCQREKKPNVRSNRILLLAG